jgi:hypothetical protein
MYREQVNHKGTPIEAETLLVGEGVLLGGWEGVQALLAATTPTTVRHFTLDRAHSILLTYIQSPTMDHLLRRRRHEELLLQRQALL